MKEIIKLDKVWKVYEMNGNSVEALKNVSLNIKNNEFLSIMGPSGSGKSTLLNSIGCLDFPTKGKIFLKGNNISKLDESQLAEIRGKTIGFIFQTFNLLYSLSVLENVMLPMAFQDKNKEERKKRARKLLISVGLKERLNHRPNQLSGGEMQRVAIARSLANDPEVILADEPTGNLDSKNGQLIMEILKKLHKQGGKTLILVTHDINLAKYANKQINILDGILRVKRGRK